MPKVVLEGLKKYPVRITAVSAMLDSGGSAGRERKEYQTGIAFGDFRRAVLALADVKPRDKEMFAYRYKNGPLAGHVLANLYCSAMVVTGGDLRRSIDELLQDIREDLNIPPQHQVLPVTLDNSHLCAELENGQIVVGEGNIDVPSHDGKLKIKNVFLTPQAKANPKAIKEVIKADLLVLGPGDLYSSLAQILLTEGMSQAIRKSRAKKVYLCNAMTKYGETNDFSVLDFTQVVEKMLGTELDKVVYNNSSPSKETIRKYKRKHKELVKLVSYSRNLPKKKFIGKNLLKKGTLEHDPQKVAKILISFL